MRAILFDLDETLLDRTKSLIAFLVDQHERFRSRLGGAPFEIWLDRFLTLDARGITHKSVVYPAILNEFSGDLSAAPLLLDDYKRNCRRHASAFPGTVETLSVLRSLGVRLGIVTNGEVDFQTAHIEALGLSALVDAVLISQAEGLRKPAAELFQRAAARLGTPVEQCLFVGDNPVADILGAHAAGMRTAWFSHGADWPDDIAPMPGAVIDQLSDVLALMSAS